jgi:hypothetical protein
MPNQKNLLPNPVASVPFLFVWIFTIPSCSHTRRQRKGVDDGRTHHLKCWVQSTMYTGWGTWTPRMHTVTCYPGIHTYILPLPLLLVYLLPSCVAHHASVCNLSYTH